MSYIQANRRLVLLAEVASGMKRVTLLVTTILVVSACGVSDPERPYWEEHISWVSSVVVPDTVSIGIEFDVVINAYGGDGYSRVSREKTYPFDNGVIITPYDWEYYPEGGKYKALQGLVHRIPMTRNQLGKFEVRVRHQEDYSSGKWTIGTISKEVIVVPED